MGKQARTGKLAPSWYSRFQHKSTENGGKVKDAHARVFLPTRVRLH